MEGASRWLFWPAAVRFWLDAPSIGNGFASFSFMFHNGLRSSGAHPHNVVLQIAAELGSVGLVLFGVFVWSGVRHAGLRRLRDDPLMVCVLAYFITAIQKPMFAQGADRRAQAVLRRRAVRRSGRQPRGDRRLQLRPCGGNAGARRPDTPDHHRCPPMLSLSRD